MQDGDVVAEGVTGGSVLLPCATSDIKHDLSDINVFWRHNDNLPVCDIIYGNFSLQDQDFNFKNRVETFPTEYKKGNFSLKLNNLTHTDGGNYLCFILHSSERVIIQLIIKESKVQTTKQPTEENGNQARETHSRITVLGVFILLGLVIGVLFIWKKWCKKEETLPHRDVLYVDPELHGNGNIEPDSHCTSVPENTRKNVREASVLTETPPANVLGSLLENNLCSNIALRYHETPQCKQDAETMPE